MVSDTNREFNRSRSNALRDDALTGALTLTAAVSAVFTYSFASAWVRRGAPFVPTAASKVNAMFAPDGLLARHIPARKWCRMHLVDLGSGDGAVVRAAVRRGSFSRATGYEINPALIACSRLLSLISQKEQHRMQSLWTADLSEADVVCVYGVPSMLDALEDKLVRELPAGSHVLSNLFEMPMAMQQSLLLL